MRRKWAGILILAACASPLPAQEMADDGGAIQVVGQPAEVEKEGRAARQEVADDPRSRIQNGFPSELILPLPAVEVVKKSEQFVQGMIDPELPLNLVIGRPKVLQLAKAPKRIYVPDDEVIRTEIIDNQSGRVQRHSFCGSTIRHHRPVKPR